MLDLSDDLHYRKHNLFPWFSVWLSGQLKLIFHPQVQIGDLPSLGVVLHY